MNSTHYSKAQQLTAMSRVAKSKADYIIKLFSSKRYKGYKPLLAYSGMSGIAFATMIAFHLSQSNFKYAMAYVRKPRENSHGNNVEMMYDKNTTYQFVFVDDFISSGATLQRVMKGINDNTSISVRYGIPSENKKPHVITIVQQGRLRKYRISPKFA